MSDTRLIQIDFDVHKRIEAERRSFSETENDVLRRLLGMETAASGSEKSRSLLPASTGRAWSGKGVTLPHGTLLRMDYNGVQYSGMIVDGRWVVEGQSFGSPSAAAGGVAKTKSGSTTSLDGWKLWHVKLPSDPKWSSLSSLRV